MQKILLIVRPTEDSTWFEYQAANKILARKPFVELLRRNGLAIDVFILLRCSFQIDI
jgi:hypothetical protein